MITDLLKRLHEVLILLHQFACEPAADLEEAVETVDTIGGPAHQGRYPRPDA